MSDAEDILQDTLLKYMQSAPVFENAQHEKAWLLCVASNLCKNKLSYNKIRETDELLETLTAEEREDLSFVWNAGKIPGSHSSLLRRRLFHTRNQPHSEPQGKHGPFRSETRQRTFKRNLEGGVRLCVNPIMKSWNISK